MATRGTLHIPKLLHSGGGDDAPNALPNLLAYLESQNLLNGFVNDTLGIPGAKVVSPGRPAQSVLHARVSTNGPIRMPPLARNEVDTQAVNVITEWIRQAAQPAWQTVTVTASNTTVSWASIAGSAYRLQTRSNLVNAAWVDLPGDVMATGPATTIIDPRVPLPQAFYRVVLLP